MFTATLTCPLELVFKVLLIVPNFTVTFLLAKTLPFASLSVITNFLATLYVAVTLGAVSLVATLVGVTGVLLEPLVSFVAGSSVKLKNWLPIIALNDSFPS